MGFAEYSDFDGLGLAELVKKKKVKPAELIEAAIERIERHNPRLNAVVFKAYDEARAKARAKLSGAFAGVPMLLALQNVTGQPAISLPLAWSKSGLPIGLQFVGRFGEEHLLLQLAAQIEKAEPWSKKRPPVYD